ncbi:hypothetical protein WISP_94731 [Willisornis vidua]|uniref:Uncharacterized protein n=1 Tax=Willisornis vidua TaxID=1566151 RepID=A0ABQ9D695_9PASS|nr:hypothetical protein WISP_94731 [Willisornis vidua]
MKETTKPIEPPLQLEREEEEEEGEEEKEEADEGAAVRGEETAVTMKGAMAREERVVTVEEGATARERGVVTRNGAHLTGLGTKDLDLSSWTSFKKNWEVLVFSSLLNPKTDSLVLAIDLKIIELIAKWLR